MLFMATVFISHHRKTCTNLNDVINNALQAIFLCCLVISSAIATNRNYSSEHSLEYSKLDKISKMSSSLPIENVFKFPSPLPKWSSSGSGFGTGKIDLGGLIVSQISTFTKIWTVQQGGNDDLGATFFEPSRVPNGFHILGCYGQPNNIPLFGWVLVAKDATSDGSALKMPVDYTLVWSSENAKIKQNGAGYIWSPVPPDGYKAIGHLVTTSPQKPPLEKIRCVRADFTDVSENDRWIWGVNELNVYSSRPRDRGTHALGVSTGIGSALSCTFSAQLSNGNPEALSCLKNINKNNTNAMPNPNQIETLIKTYSPTIYFHSDEQFFPSSVPWFFRNGALLYTRGQESTPVPVEPTGANLPRGGSNDGAFWLDLPTGETEKETVKKGNLKEAECYIHVKPMLGGTFTDLAVWVFYPFNGPARAKLEFLTIKLGRIGEHVGDWEHVTLRISNFDGELKNVYFSEHSGGMWASPPEIEFSNANKPVVYSSLHGHAAYPKPGLVLQGSNKNIGIRNDTEKANVFWDTGDRYSVVSVDYLGSYAIARQPPLWLDYAREWGPKISYDIASELKKVERFMPKKIREELERVVRSLPSEVLGEQGPTGPKWKDNWSGDER